jgi:hypothetical protein
MKHCVLVFAFCLATVFGMGSARAAGCDFQQVTGRWKQVSAKINDKPDAPPQGATRLLIIVPGYATTVDYDAAGKVTDAAGGAASVSGDAAHWTPEFRLKEEGPPLNQDSLYSCDLQGNRVTFKGDFRPNGPTVESVWEKVAATPPPATKKK